MALPKHGIGTSLMGFLKATISGGLLFLLPVERNAMLRLCASWGDRGPHG